MPPKQKDRGQDLYAKDWNELVALVNRVANLQVSYPLELRHVPGGGISLGVVGDFAARERLARITDVAADLSSEGDAPASSVLYSYRLLGQSDVGEDLVAPTIGRPVTVETHRVIPAKVGDLCRVYRVSGGFDGTAEGVEAILEVFSERRATALCE